ncbi:MAG: HNH endonuclease [Candidatus Sabulitectum sp.]|nr:HNH endonuclease [Candidatus Sabulitectum sp.]
MVTQSRLKELFSYNPDDGLFTRIAPVKKANVGDIAGCHTKNGYITISVDCKTYYAHRLAFLYVHGYLPKQIDHKDLIRHHNWIDNLRPANHQLNEANKRQPKNALSPYKGVQQHGKKWKARIKVNKKEIHLGMFECPIEGAKAYNEAAKKHFGEYARLNNV